MLTLAKSLFQQLDASGINYCHWKSNIRLMEGLQGKTDLDLLVRHDQVIEFTGTVNRLGFKSVHSEAWKRYPSIVDFIGFDADSGRFLHLHVHYKLIMGKRLLKEYHMPWGKILLEGEQRLLGVRVPSPETELFVYVLRMAVKREIFPIRSVVKHLLGKSKFLSDDLNELQWLVKRSSSSGLSKLMGTLGLSDILRKNVFRVALNPTKTNKRELRLIKTSIESYRRFSKFYGGLLLVKGLSLQALSIGKHQKGKNIESGGTTLSVLGTDGSGKTTLCHLLSGRLGWKLCVKIYYLGSSRYSFITFLIVILSLPFRFFEKIFPSVSPHCIPFILYRALLEISYANDRLRRFKKGVEAAAHGAIVIFERFPFPGVIDWPLWMNQEIAAPGSHIVRITRKYIDEVYAQIKAPRLLIFLDFSPQAAHKRKPDHSIDLIAGKRERLTALFNESGLNSDVYSIDAAQSPEEIARRVTRRIWEQI